MNKTIIFLETSASPKEAKKILPNAIYKPSIRKGDVIKAIKEGYERIAIIDGTFGLTASVWHKEILMALDYGIEVLGAASMGALRAAELDSYGMNGLGAVYSMYKNNVVDADDEVAIAFSPISGQQTIPLINIRATLEPLQLEKKESVFASIKKIFYAERTWHKLAECLPKTVFDLIQLNYIDLKKEDALALLTHISRLDDNQKINLNPLPRQFTLFEKKLIESVYNSVIFNKIEIKQHGDFNQMIRAKNLLSLLSLPKTKQNVHYFQSFIYLIDKQPYRIREEEVLEQLNLFREEKNLLTGSDFKRWLLKQKLFHSNLEIILNDYIKINKYLLMTYDYNQYLR